MNQNSNPFNHRLSPIDLRIDQFGGISSSMPLDKLNKLLAEKMEINAQHAPIINYRNILLI